MEQKTYPDVCMGLVRLIGCIFGLGIAMIIFSYLKSSWGLNIRYIIDIQTIGWPAYKAVLIAAMGGFIGMIIGQVIGSAIKIYDDDLASRITIYWHYIINGIVIWTLLCNTITSAFVFGNNQETMKNFYMGIGETFPYWGAFFGGLAGCLIVIAMGIGGRKMRYSYSVHSGLFYVKVVPYVVSIGLAAIYYQMYDFPGFLCILTGFVFPHILIYISAYLWEKDMKRRNPYLLL